MAAWFEDPKLWLAMVGVIGTSSVTLWQVRFLLAENRAKGEHLDRLERWKQRVSTVMSENGMPVPPDA